MQRLPETVAFFCVGELKSKKLISIPHGDDGPDWELNIRLTDDPSEYKVSYEANWIDKCVQEGDTVELSTINNFSKFGEAVIPDRGDGITYNRWEVFQMFSKKDSTMLINFKAYQKSMQEDSWLQLSFPLIFLIWYLYLHHKSRNISDEQTDGYSN
jgi:hypothetical protein